MATDKRKTQLDTIKKLFVKSREYGDDKVQLAMQTYEMVGQLENCTTGVNNVFVEIRALTLFRNADVLCRQIVVKFSFKVDKHIRKLDSDLARFEQELKDKSQGICLHLVLILGSWTTSNVRITVFFSSCQHYQMMITKRNGACRS